MLLEMLVHLWKEAVINKAFVLHRPSIHVLVKQAIPGIIVDEVHARELAFVLNTVMVLHKNAQERSNAGRRFHNKMKLKLGSPKRISLQQGIGTPFCERHLMHATDPLQCKSNSHQ